VECTKLARKLAKSGFVTIAELARKLGVSGQAVSQAVRSGRLRAYDGHGERVPPGYTGRKWLEPASAAEDWHNRRQRYDDPVASGDLVSARTRVVDLQGQLLELRRARENGELISRAEAFASAETLGRGIQRALKGIVGWSEALMAAGRDGDVGAVSVILKTKFAGLENSIQDMIAAAIDEFDHED
jgi:hypothetical protein